MINFLYFYLQNIRYLWLAIVVFTTCSLLILPAQAETMKSDSYQVTFGNFNVTSGEKSSTTYNLTDTVGQMTPGQFTGTGYLVKSGFQYIYPFRTFSFKISKLTINFGDITYGSFATDSHSLTVDTDGAAGYTVQAAEIHPLRLQSSTDIIPDTSCDLVVCTETSAEEWIDATNPGFGFNADGDDVSVDFLNTDYFRPFADLSDAEIPQTIMSANTVVTNRNAIITYQVAPTAIQPSGLYETLIIYRAIPSY